MTTAHIERDLLALREIIAQLGRAVAVSDLGKIEGSTRALRDFIAGGDLMPGLDESGRDLVRDIDLQTADVARALASRLRAYDRAIAAWRDMETGR